MTDHVWVDDRLVPVDHARVSVLDHAFTVGDAVFETMRTVDGVPFALSRHLRRLARSAAGLGLAPPDESRVRAAIAETLAQPGAPAKARLRVTYGGGIGPSGSDRGTSDPTLVVTVAPLPVWDAVTAVATVPWVRNERSAVAGLKTTSYAENVVALEAAHRAGATEALLANTRDELCEGTGSNVFVVRDGVLLTPALDSGCLAGITRELVLEWCRLRTSIEVREEAIPWAELPSVDELFLTSSTRDVQPVGRVDDRTLLGAPGPVTREVAALFAAAAAENVDP